jgi:Bax protein
MRAWMKDERAMLAAAAMAVSLAIVLAVAVASLWSLRIPDFTAMEHVDQRKQAFFEFMLPIVSDINGQILEDRDALERIDAQLEAGGEVGFLDSLWLESMADRYRLDMHEESPRLTVKTLLRRVDVVPPSLALAQSAVESAWGRSRFARNGNNYFGIWCYWKDCGLVPGRREVGKRHEVRRFASPQESAQRYVRTLNTAPFYRRLRRIRAHMRQTDQPLTGSALARGLEHYSERGEAYIADLLSVIRINELSRFDRALAPS